MLDGRGALHRLNAYIYKTRRGLSEDEILSLVAQAQAGDKLAAQIVVEEHLPIVAALTNVFAAPEHHEESIQEGTIGLCIAVQRFEAVGRAKFRTYAYFWVKQNVIRWYHRYRRYRSRLVALSTPLNDRSFAGGDGEIGPITWLKDESTPSQDDHMAAQCRRELVRDLLTGLPFQQKRILYLYYWRGLKLHEIGDRYHLTRQRIHQIILSAHDTMLRRCRRTMKK